MEFYFNWFFNQTWIYSIYSWPSLFTKLENNYFVALTVYVDDLIITSNNKNAIKEVKRYLHEVFSIKDLGKLKFILGLEVARNKLGIHLYQRKYTLDLLEEYGFLECKSVNTPITTKQQDHSSTKPLEDIIGYRQPIGKLLY